MIGSPTVLLPVSDFYVFPSGYFELLQRYKGKYILTINIISFRFLTHDIQRKTFVHPTLCSSMQ